MNIIKKAELQTKQDLFLLVIINNFIITNSRSSGIRIFDDSLNQLSELVILDEMRVYHTYKHFLKNEFILYCPEDYRLILIDVLTLNYKIIPLSRAVASKVFSPAYCWDSDYVIFTTYDCQYYMLNIKTGLFHNIDNNFVREKCSDLSLLMKAKFEVFSTCPKLKNGYIVNDSQDGSPVTIITTTKIINIESPIFMYHDIVYTYGVVIFIGETNIQLVNELGEKFTLDPTEGYYFLKADMFEGTNGLELVSLSASICNPKDSCITTYQLCDVK